MSTTAPTLEPAAAAERITWVTFALRVVWIAVRLVLAYWLAWQARPFFYQRF